MNQQTARPDINEPRHKWIPSETREGDQCKHCGIGRISLGFINRVEAYDYFDIDGSPLKQRPPCLKHKPKPPSQQNEYRRSKYGISRKLNSIDPDKLSQVQIIVPNGNHHPEMKTKINGSAQRDVEELATMSRMEADFHDSVVMLQVVYREVKELGAVTQRTVGMIERFLTSQKYEHWVKHYKEKSKQTI